MQKLQKERAMRLSPAALETLAIIAYRQPVTRAEIEEVRGVDAGATVKSLLERHLIRIAGQREVPGRPMLYGTTRRFLEVFGLERLKDLPTLRELDELAREQGLLEKTADDAVVDGILDGAAEAVGEPEETDTEETEGALASGSEEADVTDLNAVTGLVEEEAAEGDDVADAAGAEGLISVEAEADVATDIDDDDNNNENNNERGSALSAALHQRLRKT